MILETSIWILIKTIWLCVKLIVRIYFCVIICSFWTIKMEQLQLTLSLWFTSTSQWGIEILVSWLPWFSFKVTAFVWHNICYYSISVCWRIMYNTNPKLILDLDLLVLKYLRDTLAFLIILCIHFSLILYINLVHQLFFSVNLYMIWMN